MARVGGLFARIVHSRARLEFLGAGRHRRGMDARPGPRGGRRAGRPRGVRHGVATGVRRVGSPARADRRSLCRPARHAVPGRGRRCVARRAGRRAGRSDRLRQRVRPLRRRDARARGPARDQRRARGRRAARDDRGRRARIALPRRRAARSQDGLLRRPARQPAAGTSPVGAVRRAAWPWRARAQLLLLHGRLLGRDAGGRRRVGPLHRLVGRCAADGAGTRQAERTERGRGHVGRVRRVRCAARAEGAGGAVRPDRARSAEVRVEPPSRRPRRARLQGHQPQCAEAAGAGRAPALVLVFRRHRRGPVPEDRRRRGDRLGRRRLAGAAPRCGQPTIR